MHVMSSDRLARLLADDYVAGLEQLALAEVRSRRHECQEVEVALSYARRIVQGRLDIIHAELERRASGGGRSDASDLVDRLKEGEILGDHARPPGLGRLPTLMEPGEESDEFLAEANEVAHEDALASLPDSGDEEVRRIGDVLAGIERGLSDMRRSVFDRIEIFQHEIVRRYKTGAATADSLLSS
jgi:hypothetical protein